MRKLIISLGLAGAALAVATPAAAQYYPGQYGGAPYGNAYGYNNNWGQVRALQSRINRIEWQINQFDRRDRIGGRSADRLRDEANNIERRLRHAARDGMSPWEAQDIQVRIARLEQRVQYSMAYRNRGYGNGYGYNNGYGNGYGNNGGFYDRDRDGRDDRYENDQGRDHDD